VCERVEPFGELHGEPTEVVELLLRRTSSRRTSVARAPSKRSKNFAVDGSGTPTFF
jgi:hypothetical protein